MKTLLLLLFPFLCTAQDTAHLKGDGSDETASFQAQLNKSSNLVVPAGTYFIGKVGLHSNLVLKGLPGAKLRMIQGPLDNIMLSLWQCNNVRITGLEIALNGIQGSIMDGTAAVELYGCNNIEIDSCFIHDNTYVGIRLVGGNSNVRVLHNLIQNTDTDVWCNNVNSNVVIHGNMLEGGSSENITILGYHSNSEPYNFTIDSNIMTGKLGSFAINLPFARAVLIEHNTITNCLGGIMMHDPVSNNNDSIYTSNVTISSNLISGCTYGIINVGDSSLVQGNTLSNIQWDGIQAGYINHTTTGVIINGNTLLNVALIGGGTAGINLTGVNICTVQGNTIRAGTPLRVSGKGLLVSGNN